MRSFLFPLALGVTVQLTACNQLEATGSTGVATTGSSSSTGITPGCIPASGSAIAAECGVFVEAGATGDGSQSSPTGSLSNALGLARGKPIYVCAAPTPLTETVTITTSATLFGGFDCTSWVYDATPSKLEGLPNLPTLSITGASTVAAMSDFDISSVDATTLGASSAAAWAADATVEMTRVSLHAGADATGPAGTPRGPSAPAPSGMGGTTACAGATGIVAGGDSGHLVCQGTDVEGGLGGNGTNGLSGGAGSPGNGPSPGTAGVGEPAAGQCSNGGLGGVGTAGSPGPGALATDLGTLDGTGYAGALGGAGQSPGAPGSGGGGGGGANACTGSGPSGGGGGAGGCGGAAGNGGGGGGGSFALVSINANVTLTNVALDARAGGNGGAGDAGQVGQDGGSGGPAGGPNDACPGGKGGKGGQGGAGGGGRGGPSVGIASVGAAPSEMMVTITVATTAAPGGAGGNGGVGNQGASGATGLLAQRQAF